MGFRSTQLTTPKHFRALNRLFAAIERECRHCTNIKVTIQDQKIKKHTKFILRAPVLLNAVTDGEFTTEADFNQDCQVNLLDIAPLVQFLTGGLSQELS